MATFVIDSNLNFDQRAVDFGNLYAGTSYITQPTLFRANYTGGNAEEFRGTGFTYDNGVPTGGIAHSYNGFLAGKKVITFAGFNFAATKINAVALTNSTSDDLALVNSAFVGNDAFTGGAGADYLSAFGGNDTMNGRAGADTLLGGVGNDRITGGLGQDKLYGGAHNDIFIFNVAVTAANRDVIYDFNVGNDTIHLENTFFTKAGVLGQLNIAAFKLSTQVKDANDRIIYNKATGQVSYDSDGSGAIAPILFVTLHSKPTVTAADFVVI